MFSKPNGQPRGSHRPPQDAAREGTRFPLQSAQRVGGMALTRRSGQPRSHQVLPIPRLLPTMRGLAGSLPVIYMQLRACFMFVRSWMLSQGSINNRVFELYE